LDEIKLYGDFNLTNQQNTVICIAHKQLNVAMRCVLRAQNAFAARAPPWTLLGRLQHCPKHTAKFGKEKNWARKEGEKGGGRSEWEEERLVQLGGKLLVILPFTVI